MAVTIGEFQGFKMSVSFDSFFSKFTISLKGSLSVDYYIHFCNEDLYELQRHVANRTDIMGKIIGSCLIFAALLILIFG